MQCYLLVVANKKMIANLNTIVSVVSTDYITCAVILISTIPCTLGHR